MKICSVFSLKSPHRGDSAHRGDSNKSTQSTIFGIKKKITLNYPKSIAMFFSKVLEHEFEAAVVNEPSVFETLKF